MTERDDTIEKRTSKRFPLRLHMALKTPGLQHETETANISSAGVLFEADADADITVGSPIEFAITMPAKVLGTPVDVLVNCTGRVVRCSGTGEMRTVAAVIDEYRFDRT